MQTISPFLWFDSQAEEAEAISLFVSVDTQAEIDRIWEALAEGGQHGQCGWLKDKYGLSWQIVPPILGELLGSSDPEASSRVLRAMFGMTKLDIEGLREAANG